MNGRKHANRRSPGGRASSNPIQERGQLSRSRQPAGTWVAATVRAARVTLEVFALEIVRAMQPIAILNHRHHHRGFVYRHARFGPGKRTIEVDVRPREGTAPVCSGCHTPDPGYDHLPERRFECIPFGCFPVFFPYRMRRVDCRNCGMVVEEVPWGKGKHQSTKAHMLFLAGRPARKLSWRETAEALHTSWDRVCDSVEYVVHRGLEHRTLAPIRAIGVDEIQYAGPGGGPDLAGHEQFISVCQLFRQQPIQLIFQPRRRLPTRRPVSHVLPRDAIPPAMPG